MATWKECIFPHHFCFRVLVCTARTRYFSTMRLCLNTTGAAATTNAVLPAAIAAASVAAVRMCPSLRTLRQHRHSRRHFVTDPTAVRLRLATVPRQRRHRRRRRRRSATDATAPTPSAAWTTPSSAWRTGSSSARSSRRRRASL